MPKIIILRGVAVQSRENSLAAHPTSDVGSSIRTEVLSIEARHTCLLLPKLFSLV